MKKANLYAWVSLEQLSEVWTCGGKVGGIQQNFEVQLLLDGFSLSPPFKFLHMLHAVLTGNVDQPYPAGLSGAGTGAHTHV